MQSSAPRPPSRTATVISMKPPSQSTADDRFTSLQRKLGSLEKMHAEGKKSHQTELATAKADLAAAHLANTDLMLQIERLKKHAEVLDARAQEQKRTALTDQTELKDLRAKLRLAEAERAQLSARQGEASDSKRALHALEARRKEEIQAAESRRREEVRERDKRIAEVEKALAAEKKRRETVEARAAGVRGKAEGQTERVKSEARALEAGLQDARGEVSQLRADLKSAEGREEQLLQRLDACQAMLERVAEEYGQLAASTVALEEHRQLKEAYYTLELHTFRLDRKLANSEAQVVELARLIRQSKEEKVFMLERVRDIDEERSFYFSAYHDLADSMPLSDYESSSDPAAAQLTSMRLDKDIADVAASGYRSIAHYYFLLNRELMQEYRNALDDIMDEQAVTSTQKKLIEKEIASRTALSRELQDTLDQLASARQEHTDISTQLRETKADVLELREKVKVISKEKLDEITAHQHALRREKDASQKLALTAQMHKAAEDALRGEVEQLSAELVDAERYQEAYYALSDKVGDLAARNALAEGEAERLSRFNAEILSHNNPAQRIMYLDRIRRELADAKQNLVAVTRDKDTALAQAGELLQELAIYKSTAIVPGSVEDYRPKTTITRVARIPLGASRSLNGQSTAVLSKISIQGSLPQMPSENDDMTLDEIL